MAPFQAEVWGAQGGWVEKDPDNNAVGGLGARMRGDFSLDPGTVLSVLVGQQGTSNSLGSSGGGGGRWCGPSTWCGRAACRGRAP